jgi:hypothetical protein
MEKNPNFVSFILLIKLKSNRDHVYGLNWIIANIVKISKMHYIVIRFFCKIHSYKKKKTYCSDFSIRYGPQLT